MPRCQYHDRQHKWWPCEGELTLGTDCGGAIEVWRCEQHTREHEAKLEIMEAVRQRREDLDYYAGVRAESQLLREAREDREYYARIRAEAAEIARSRAG